MEIQTTTPFYHPPIDKSFFGAYLNMARSNLHMVLTHIDEKVHNQKRSLEEDRMQESELIKSLQSKTHPDVTMRVLDMLKQHLPFLKLIVESKQNPIARSLCSR